MGIINENIGFGLLYSEVNQCDPVIKNNLKLIYIIYFFNNT